MPVILPFKPSTASYSFKTTLDNVVYGFDVHWNFAEDAYYFDVLDAFGNEIYSDIKVVLGVVLGSRCSDARFPPGWLIAADTSQTAIDAKYADLGGRVRVVYYGVDEIAAAAAAVTGG